MQLYFESKSRLKRILKMISHSILIDLFKKRIPKLVNDLHKGQCGRIGIIGGSKELVSCSSSNYSLIS